MCVCVYKYLCLHVGIYVSIYVCACLMYGCMYVYTCISLCVWIDSIDNRSMTLVLKHRMLLCFFLMVEMGTSTGKGERSEGC